MTGRERTLRLPSSAVASGGKLQLTFANRPDSVARAILQHYHATTGGFNSFSLSNNILADWDSIYRTTLKGAEWTYDAAPQVTTAHPGYSTTSVRLLLTKSGNGKSKRKDPVGPPLAPECEPPLLPELPTNPGNGPDRINGGVDGDGGPDGSTSTPSPGPGDPVQPPDDNPIKVGTYPIPEPPGTEGQIKNWTVYYKSVSIAGELKRCSDDELINSNDLEYGEEKILTGQGTLLSIEIDKVTTTITCENIPNEDYLKPVLTLTTTQLDGSQKKWDYPF